MGIQMLGKETKTKASPVKVDEDYGDVRISYGDIFLWGFTVSDTPCCGVMNLHEFSFQQEYETTWKSGKPSRKKNPRPTQEQFNEGADKFFAKGGGCAWYELVLTATKDTEECQQPLLQKYLEQKDDVFCTPWRLNPNSENLNQVWLIATE